MENAVDPVSLSTPCYADDNLGKFLLKWSFTACQRRTPHAQNPKWAQMRVININGLSQYQRTSNFIAYFNEAMDGFVKVAVRGEAAVGRLEKLGQKINQNCN